MSEQISWFVISNNYIDLNRYNCVNDPQYQTQDILIWKDITWVNFFIRYWNIKPHVYWYGQIWHGLNKSDILYNWTDMQIISFCNLECCIRKQNTNSYLRIITSWLKWDQLGFLCRRIFLLQTFKNLQLGCWWCGGGRGRGLGWSLPM